MEHKIAVDRNSLHHYRLKITTLSPVHIGTGDVYEPTSFVIDGNRLYAFDEVLFYQSLSPLEKVSLNAKLGDWMQIINFYKEHIASARKITFFECDVTNKVADRYSAKKNKDGSINYNQLQINTVYKNPNTYRAVIPGSSIKGMFDTVLQIYPQKIKDNIPRQNLIVSDALLLEGGVEIGYSYRRHKDPSKTSRSDIPQMVEVIKQGSSFVFSLSADKTFEEIKSQMQRYLNERGDNRYRQSENGFVARIGKYSGKAYMVDDGKNVLNSYDKPVATHTVFEKGDAPFGWIKIELLMEEDYEEAMESIAMQEAAYYTVLEEKQKEIREKIAHAKAEAKAAALKKEQERIAQQKAEAEAKACREAQLAAMDPLDRLIDSYGNDPARVINAMKDGRIENIEEIRIELAKKLKVIMQKEPKQWEKAKQKALKRKEYIQSLLSED